MASQPELLEKARSQCRLLSDPQVRVRALSWVKRIEFSPTTNRAFARIRRQYIVLLLQQLGDCLSLSSPFHVLPPDGCALDRLPAEALSQLRQQRTPPRRRRRRLEPSPNTAKPNQLRSSTPAEQDAYGLLDLDYAAAINGSTPPPSRLLERCQQWRDFEARATALLVPPRAGERAWQTLAGRRGPQCVRVPIPLIVETARVVVHWGSVFELELRRRHQGKLAWEFLEQGGSGGRSEAERFYREQLVVHRHRRRTERHVAKRQAKLQREKEASYGDWREQERAERKWSQKLSAS